MSVPGSAFAPPPAYPLVVISLFSTFKILYFCFVNKFICTFFFKKHSSLKYNFPLFLLPFKIFKEILVWNNGFLNLVHCHSLLVETLLKPFNFFENKMKEYLFGLNFMR